MAFKDLGGFLRRLEDEGELRRVAAEVDPILEIAEITDRVSKSPSGGKALFFEKVKGSPFPVVTNLFGSAGRICLALGLDGLDGLSRRMEGLLERIPPYESGDLLFLFPSLQEFSRFAPLTVADGGCREVTEVQPDLGLYPILKNFELDGSPGGGGRFITLPVVITADPDSGARNCGIYRVEVLAGDRAAIHWRESSGGGTHWRKYRDRGQRMPLAIVLGGEPACTFSASLPLPPNVDEMTFAGFLRGEPLSVVRCTESDLRVPAGAEMVIEGYIEPGETCDAGAFGNHTGFYSSAGNVPLVTVTAISRRREMVYPATVVGRPPMEDCYLAKAGERLMLPVIRRELPWVVDIHLPLEGIFHGCAIVSVHKDNGDTPRRTVAALWEKRLLGEGRILVVVDAATDVQDLSLVAWQAMNLVDWRVDVMVDAPSALGTPMGRIALDATHKGRNPLHGDGMPVGIGRGEVMSLLVAKRWREYGI